jgi:tetratricopeptide (TPR) repeat protein
MTEAPVEIFCCYIHTDEVWLQKLEAHLSLLQQQGLISFRYAQLNSPGTHQAKTIERHLETASIILFLVSAGLLASEFYYNVAIKRALARQKAGKVEIVPILVHPVDWQNTSLAHLQPLPANAKPLTTWKKNQEMALAGISSDIRRTVQEMSRPPATTSATTKHLLWNLPYPRNPFFLGRDTELAQIHIYLQGAPISPKALAISGLGGIGKTQLALEYAYRHSQDYRAILWAHAESAEALASSSIALASLLQLPEREDKEQNVTIQALKNWLETHHDWLLILDNADELTILHDFLPRNPKGHVLLTTRATATGRLAQRMEIKTFLPQHGARFLLQRAALIPLEADLELVSPQEHERALQMSSELGGLPLALNQAGAYIEATGIDLFSYWQIYQQHRADLLHYRGKLETDPSVATTWSVSFHRTEEKHPAAADLLRLCAFLSPDAIPEEILTTEAPFLGPTLAPVAAHAILLNEAIEALRAYSLIQRDPKGKTLSIHCLVQAVLQDTLAKEQRHVWAERAMLMVNAAFPDAKHGTETKCERLLPQALRAAQMIEHYQIIRSEAGRLLYETASYLKIRGRYTSAELLFLQAIPIWEQQFGMEHPFVVNARIGLATLYLEHGQYEKAEKLFLSILHICEQYLGAEHFSAADTVYGLASLYRERGKFVLAELFFFRALSIREQHLGTGHPSVGKVLSGLAYLYRQDGKYAEAELLCKWALHIWEQQPDLEHFDMTYPPHNILAGLYRTQGKYQEAEALLLRALSIWEQQPGPEHPDMGYPLNSLAVLYCQQGKYKDAESLYQRALSIREPQLGPDHPYITHSLSGLATLYYEQGQYAQAEPLLLRALHIWAQALLPEHPRAAEVMYDLARLREAQGLNDEARNWYARSLEIRKQVLGVYDPKTVETLQHLTALIPPTENHEEIARIETFRPNNE